MHLYGPDIGQFDFTGGITEQCLTVWQFCYKNTLSFLLMCHLLPEHFKIRLIVMDFCLVQLR